MHFREAAPEEQLLQSMGQVPVMKPVAPLNVLQVQDSRCLGLEMAD